MGASPWMLERCPCGSRSISRGGVSARWRAAPRLRVVVVFPTPPFWLKMAMRMAQSFYTRLYFSLNLQVSATFSGHFGLSRGGRSGGDGRRFVFWGWPHVACHEYLCPFAGDLQSWQGLPLVRYRRQGIP